MLCGDIQKENIFQEFSKKIFYVIDGNSFDEWKCRKEAFKYGKNVGHFSSLII